MSKQLFGNASIYLGANMLNAIVPFLLLPVLTRVLTPADYGIVAVFSVMASIFGAFTGLSVYGAVGVRYFQLERAALARYVGACVVILLASTAFVLVVIWGMGNWLADRVEVSANWLLVAVLMSGTQMLISIQLSLYQVAHKAKQYAALQISQAITAAGISLFLILGVGMAWEGRLLGQVIPVAIFGTLTLYLLSRNRQIAMPDAGEGHVVDALKFGVPLIPHVIGGLLISAVDRLVIVNLLDVTQAGIYVVALQLGQALGLLTQSFNSAYAPWLIQTLSKKDSSGDKLIVKGTYLYFIVIILIALIYGWSAPYFIEFLVGGEFKSASDFVIYIAVGHAFGGMYYMVANYIFYANKTAYLAWITFAAGLLDFCATYFLVQSNGLMGAAQAFALSQAVFFLGTWWFAQKSHPMPWRLTFVK